MGRRFRRRHAKAQRGLHHQKRRRQAQPAAQQRDERLRCRIPPDARQTDRDKGKRDADGVMQYPADCSLPGAAAP